MSDSISEVYPGKLPFSPHQFSNSTDDNQLLEPMVSKERPCHLQGGPDVFPEIDPVAGCPAPLLLDSSGLQLISANAPSVNKAAWVSFRDMVIMLKADSGRVFVISLALSLQYDWHDPLLMILVSYYGTVIRITDDSGQVIYIVQDRSGHYFRISREALESWYALYQVSLTERLYPEIFGACLPAGGGWHCWNYRVRQVSGRGEGGKKIAGGSKQKQPGAGKSAGKKPESYGSKKWISEKSARMRLQPATEKERLQQLNNRQNPKGPIALEKKS